MGKMLVEGKEIGENIGIFVLCFLDSPGEARIPDRLRRGVVNSQRQDTVNLVLLSFRAPARILYDGELAYAFY